MSRISVDGNDVNFATFGAPTGPTVVLLHGLLASCSMWTEVGLVGALQQDFHVVVIDAPAHGASGDPTHPEGCSRDAAAAAVLAALDELSIDSAHVVGYSMGAWVAGAVATAAPQRVASLSLGGWDPQHGAARQLEWARETLHLDITPDVFWGMAVDLDPALAMASSSRAQALRWTWAHVIHPANDLQLLEALSVPLQLWCGALDVVSDAVADVATQLGANHFQLAGDHMTALGDPQLRSRVSAFLKDL